MRRTRDGQPSTKQRTEAALVSRLIDLHGPDVLRDRYPSYTKTPAQNLVATVDVADFWDDLAAGDGNELQDTPARPAKFCAAISSSALAVNVLGLFRRRPARLSLLGYDDFTECQFERKLQTGISTPNLDFYAAGRSATVCVESKCTEPLQDKIAAFSPRYDDVVEALADLTWQRIYRSLIECPNAFSRLDVAQLVKHYLGIRHSLAGLPNPILCYLYWQPSNADQFSEFRQHQVELARFTEMTRDGEVRFVAMTYAQLFSEWERLDDAHVQSHLVHLKQRYELAI